MINDIAPPPRRRDPKPKRLEETPEPSDSAAEVFKTPEQIAAEHQNDLMENVKNLSTIEIAPQKPSRRFAWRPSRNQVIIGTVVVVLLLAAGASGWWYTHRAKPVVTVKKTTVVKKPVVVVPKTVPSTLTGLPVAPSVNAGPVTGVMVENSTFARPQSGLKEAGVVFEAVAEGGITRFLALYQDTAPANVGPIRSVRPYYEQWALGFDAAIAHVGGSPEALADIKSWGVRDLDQFANGGSYHRVTTREAPHNVYTSIALLNQLELKKGYTTSTYTGFPRKVSAPLKVPTAKSIALMMSGTAYNVNYAYDITTNSYLRSVGGTPHMDAESNTQLSPKVVVALVMPYSIASDGKHSIYNTIGSGPVTIFQDGGVTTGQWAKPSNAAQFTFTDSNGAPIAFIPGQTWLTAVSATSKISYTP